MRALRNFASVRVLATATAAMVAASACGVALAASGTAAASARTSRARSVVVRPRTAVVTRTASGGTFVTPPGIQKIKHVIVIMQENRSFDDYFGTYPGADGIPASNGQFTVCVPDPVTKGCDKPYNNPSDSDLGGCHGVSCIPTVEDGGKMDGFVASAEQFSNPTDVMGYEDAREIPNYWKYAENFALGDHFFTASLGWSLPQHLYMVSGWSAACSTTQASSCVNNINGPSTPTKQQAAVAQALATGNSDIHSSWTDITYLLNKNHVAWRYYIENGTKVNCVDGNLATCSTKAADYATPGIWDPLPIFSDVQESNQISNIQPDSAYFAAASGGTLPTVSWIEPGGPNSEHPQIGGIHEGQAYVTNLINAAMKSPEWDSTAIFLTWDEWGGFYDHVVPPTVDGNGYGIRVPSLIISPYAKKGYIDHQVLSNDAYLQFIEDDFLNGARLNPATDGRPDPRPDVRENAPQLGNILNDFDFTQTPRPPLILPLNPAPGPASTPGG
jgi:phospholipase C